MLRALAGGSLFGSATGPVADVRVLALHGWQRDHADWASVLDGLPALAIDLPGFGATPAPPEPWGSARYAAAVLPVLEELATPVVVAGHSFGGRIGIHLAVAAPELVGGLVLSGVPNLWPLPARPAPKAARRYRIGRFLHRIGLVGDDRMEQLRRRYGSADYRAASGVMRDVLVTVVNERYHECLPRIACPVELVWGDDDPAAPVDGARAAVAHLPSAHLDVVEGAGHFTLQSAPDRVRAAIDRRLAALGGPEPSP